MIIGMLSVKGALYVKLREVVFVMEKRKQEASTLDYSARSSMPENTEIKVMPRKKLKQLAVSQRNLLENGYLIQNEVAE
jgi:hypothetical protein